MTFPLLDYNTAFAHMAGSDNEHFAPSRKRLHEVLSGSSMIPVVRTVKSSKSRTGCRFCKLKRLKCDETKPECKNCLNRERKCPGYKQTYQWKSKCQTDIRSFDAALRKKTIAPRPATSKRKPKGKPTKSDEHDGNIQQTTGTPKAMCQQETTGQHETAEVDVTYDTELHELPVDSECLISMNASQNLNNIDLDGYGFNDMIESLQFDNVLGLPSLPDTDLTFSPNHGSTSVHGCLWDTAQTSLGLLQDPTDINWGISIGKDRSNISTTIAESTDRRNRGKDIRGLLRKFYTTSPSVPSTLVHHATRLVEHYFSTICGIYSCFDSFLNPFRYTVSQSWSYSASTYYGIQSMAAAHMANELPRMRQEGLVLHRKASQHLGQEFQICRSKGSNHDQALLSLLLLGMSACWQRPGDLGLPYLRTARTFVSTTLSQREATNAEPMTRSLLQFFEEAMIYWEMVTSFVADDTEIDIVQPCNPLHHVENEIFGQSQPLDPPSLDHTSDSIPHPWTGICPESQMLLGQVGRLVRRARMGKRTLENETRLFGLAMELEESLLATTTPSTSSMTDCGDLVTQDTDFITLAETTRDAGLLELYRVFPDLLWHRLGPRHNSNDDVNNGGGPNVSSEFASQSWLASLAVHILKRLETIPNSSNVRCHQLLIVVIAAAELRLPSPGKSDCLELSDLDHEVIWGRQFARTRLHQLVIQLPAQPVYTILKLVGEVWRRLDAPSNGHPDDIFWIDVMIEKGWHTIMG